MSVSFFETQCNLSSLFSPLSKLAERAIYFAYVNFFFFIFLLSAKLSQYLMDRSSRFFSPNEMYLREFSRSGPVFPIPQGTLPWQPI